MAETGTEAMATAEAAVQVQMAAQVQLQQQPPAVEDKEVQVQLAPEQPEEEEAKEQEQGGASAVDEPSAQATAVREAELAPMRVCLQQLRLSLALSEDLLSEAPLHATDGMKKGAEQGAEEGVGEEGVEEADGAGGRAVVDEEDGEEEGEGEQDAFQRQMEAEYGEAAAASSWPSQLPPTGTPLDGVGAMLSELRLHLLSLGVHAPSDGSSEEDETLREGDGDGDGDGGKDGGEGSGERSKGGDGGGRRRSSAERASGGWSEREAFHAASLLPAATSQMRQLSTELATSLLECARGDAALQVSKIRLGRVAASRNERILLCRCWHGWARAARESALRAVIERERTGRLAALEAHAHEHQKRRHAEAEASTLRGVASEVLGRLTAPPQPATMDAEEEAVALRREAASRWAASSAGSGGGREGSGGIGGGEGGECGVSGGSGRRCRAGRSKCRGGSGGGDGGGDSTAAIASAARMPLGMPTKQQVGMPPWRAPNVSPSALPAAPPATDAVISTRSFEPSHAIKQSGTVEPSRSAPPAAPSAASAASAGVSTPRSLSLARPIVSSPARRLDAPRSATSAEMIKIRRANLSSQPHAQSRQRAEVAVTVGLEGSPTSAALRRAKGAIARANASR